MTSSSLAGRLDDWINPITVKEMRQAVNSRSITWTLTGFLLIQVAIAASVLLFSETYRPDFGTGRSVFLGLLGALLGTCLLYLPISTSLRFAAERFQQNVDLLFITTLKPVQIIWGKTLAAMALLLLFFSASTPFMMMTYFLRGIDLQSSLILLGLDFLVVFACIQFGILLALMPGSQALRLLIGLTAFLGVLIVAWQSSYQILHFGIGSHMGRLGVWGPALTVAFFVILGAGWLFVLSVASVTPASANRALGVRIYLIFAWLTTGIVAGIWSIMNGNPGLIEVWLIAMALLFSLNLFSSLGEPQDPGPRVLRTIPKRRIPRLLAFFLYSGVAGGIAYSILMIIGTFVATAVFLEYFASPGRFGYGVRGAEKAFMISAGFALYALAYSLTALTIKRFFFAQSKRPQITAEIAGIILVAGLMLPLLTVIVLLSSGSLEQLPAMVSWGNPFIFFIEDEAMLESASFGGIWAVAVLVITMPWLKRQYLNFRPPVTTQHAGAGPGHE
jgi:hypothetical protein